MRYLTLITIVDQSDEQSAKQHANSLKTWRDNVFVPETHLHIFTIGDRETNRNLVREIHPVCTETKISYELEWLPTTRACALNKVISSASSQYIGLLPFQAWREPHAIQNQLSMMRNIADFTFGDYVRTDNLDQVFENVNKLTTYEKTYDMDQTRPKDYYQKSNKWGEFLMWKKSIHDVVGYFDEQLTNECEFDFINRIVSVNRMRVIKTQGVMGATCRIPVRNLKEEAEVTKRFEEKKPVKIISFGKETEWRPQ